MTETLLFSSSTTFLKNTFEFYACFFSYLFLKKKYSETSFFNHLSNEKAQRARIHIFSLALCFILWDKRHYRAKNFKQDLIKNLGNVCIPGTPIPLSFFCYTKITAYVLVLILYPLLCFISSFYQLFSIKTNVLNRKKTVNIKTWEFVKFWYSKQLLYPLNWFFLWRTNCILSSWHSFLTDSEQYKYEDKWTFLNSAGKKNIRVTPLFDVDFLVCKHKCEEGGLGIHFYHNARDGGDWIIQKKFQNHSDISKWLPENSPLSTVRVITLSKCISVEEYLVIDNTIRAGRANKLTDHNSILFDIHTESGRLSLGITNEHWYQVGQYVLCFQHFLHILLSMFKSEKKNQRNNSFQKSSINHSDKKLDDLISSAVLDISSITSMCVSAHQEMLFEVPIVGWDVAITNEGLYILEANLSSNLFTTNFNHNEYFQHIHEQFVFLESKPFKL